MSNNPHPRDYPKRTPHPDNLPPDPYVAPEDGLVEVDEHEDAGETADVDLPPMRTPVDCRQPTPAPDSNNYEPPNQGWSPGRFG